MNGVGTPSGASPMKTYANDGLTAQSQNKEMLAWQDYIAKQLNTHRFDAGIAVVIVINAFCVGLEQSLEVDGYDVEWMVAVDSFFLLIYIFEFGARIFAIGRKALRDNWVKFDLLLIVLGVVTSWVLGPVMKMAVEELGPLLVLRTLRLLRLGKTVRLLARFQEFWMFIRGLLNSASIMCYTFVVLFVVLYIFSSVGVELITKHELATGPNSDAEFAETVEKYFKSLPETMLTLVQFAVLDEIGSIYRPLINKDGWLALYFMSLILVVGIVIMSIVNAVFVNSTMEQNLEEKMLIKKVEEKKFNALIAEVRETLTGLDHQESGLLARKDLGKLSTYLEDGICDTLKVRTLGEIYDALDIDNGGNLGIDAFCDGIHEVAMSKTSLDVKRMEKQVNKIHLRSIEDHVIQGKICQQLSIMKKELVAMQGPTLAGPRLIAQAGIPELPPWAADLIVKLQNCVADISMTAPKQVGPTRSGPPSMTRSPPSPAGTRRVVNAKTASTLLSPGKSLQPASSSRPVSRPPSPLPTATPRDARSPTAGALSPRTSAGPSGAGDSTCSESDGGRQGARPWSHT